MNCIVCGRPNTREAGGIMINVCADCKNRTPAPDAFVNRNGILLSNPEYENWKQAEEARIATLNSNK